MSILRLDLWNLPKPSVAYLDKICSFSLASLEGTHQRQSRTQSRRQVSLQAICTTAANQVKLWFQRDRLPYDQ